MTRVTINPELIRWARERSGRVQADLAARFKRLPEWENGETQPTLKQVEAFARAVHVPVGYLFLTEPPEEPVPIPDFRTFARQEVTRPSPNLLDTIYTCQERQSWYRNFVRIRQEPEFDFVGSARVEMDTKTVAAEMRETLRFDLAAHRKCPTWIDALRLFIRKADKAGVLVMISGVVGSNNHRPLDPGEFRGFALSDPFAPLIFINGADTKAAQMFTLAHELAHLWLGDSALSNIEEASRDEFPREEVWCNAVAAELLVPLAALHAELRKSKSLHDIPSCLARTFKVSKLVVLRRLLDAGWFDRRTFEAAWTEEIERLRAPAQGDSKEGGNFYYTTLARVSHRFARALVVSTLEGQTLYRDAFRMLGVSKTATFNNIGREVGVMG